MASAKGKCNPIVMLENDYHFFNVKIDLETYPSDMIERVTDKLIEIVESEEFKFKTVILKLILAHEFAFMKKYKDSFNALEELECELDTLEEFRCDQDIFKNVAKAIRMVLRTCKAYVLLSQNKETEAKEMVKKITPIDKLNTANKASVYGIRSMVYMEYGLYGHKMALENAEKAKKIDTKNPYWFFLIGKSLGRIRRVEKPFDIPSDEERNALRTAIEMEEHHLFLLFMAESYVETSTRTYRFHMRNRSLYPNLKISIDQLNEEASNLYKKCIEKEPNCSHVLFRAARGFLNLPHPQRDVERAKELLLKGLKSNSRNAFANHLLARYYERFDSNIPEAIKHLKICTEQRVFGAEMDLLRLEFTKDGVAAKPVEKLEQLLDLYAEVPRRIQILAQMASFYIFVDSNLPKACELIKAAITLNCDDNILNHRSIFLRVRLPFSILDVLVDEMKMEMDRGCSKDDKDLYESFIFDLNDSNVSIPKGRGKNMKDELLNEDRETRLGNYYRRPTNTNGHTPMRRRSFAKPISRSASEQHIEKSRSVQKVDEFFDSWIDDAKRDEQKRNGFSKTNYSSKSTLSESCSDHSPANDSRFSRSNGRYDGNRNRYSRPDNEGDIQFDRLSNASSPHDRSNYSRNRQYENGNFKPSAKNDVVEELDRLSISSNRSRGRGRSSYSNSRPFQDRGDFDRNLLGRGRGRPSDSNDNRANFNNPNASRFPIGRGQGVRRSLEKVDFHDANTSKQGQATYADRTNTRSTRNDRNSENSPSAYKSGRDEFTSDGLKAKTSHQPESSRNFERKPISSRDDRNSENSTSCKNWRRESPDKIKDQQRSKTEQKKTYSDIVTKPSTKPIQNNDNDGSDSDDDIMSYFKKK